LHRATLHGHDAVLVLSGIGTAAAAATTTALLLDRSEFDALRPLLPDALAVEMEGAAVAQVCHDFGKPFAVMRTVSDRADDSAPHDFTRFVTAVASALTRSTVRVTLGPPQLD
jgi:nucleoside phosphorylase